MMLKHTGFWAACAVASPTRSSRRPWKSVTCKSGALQSLLCWTECTAWPEQPAKRALEAAMVRTLHMAAPKASRRGLSALSAMKPTGISAAAYSTCSNRTAQQPGS